MSEKRGKGGPSVMLAVPVALLIVGLLLPGAGTSEAASAPTTQQQPADVHTGQRPQAPAVLYLPDLTATITFTPKNPYQKNGVTCYSIQPTILITNQGKSASRTFKYFGDWSFSTTPSVWQLFTLNTVSSLGVGQIHTVVGANTASSALTWCPNDPGTPGYRVTIDAEKSIPEIDDDNNVVERRYHPRPPSMKKIKKGL